MNMRDNDSSPQPVIPDSDIPATLDWGEQWVRLQENRRQADNASFWDKRAATFSHKDYPNAYVMDFLRLAKLQPGETVFDMGCGNGALALPLAREGHEVLAADFSAGMLSILREDMAEAHVSSIHCLQMSWEDDWEAHGLAVDGYDVALASRSIAVHDLRRALLKLSAVARRRACITLSTGGSPRSDPRILRIAGVSGHEPLDFQFAFNILLDEGFFPEVSYIRSERVDTFESREEALDALLAMVNHAQAQPLEADKRQVVTARLEAWLDANLVVNENVGKPAGRGRIQGPLRLLQPRVVRWAFVGWDTSAYHPDAGILR